MPYFFVRKLSAVAQVGWRCCSYRQHTLALLAAGCKVALPLRLSSSAGILSPHSHATERILLSSLYLPRAPRSCTPLSTAFKCCRKWVRAPWAPGLAGGGLLGRWIRLLGRWIRLLGRWMAFPACTRRTAKSCYSAPASLHAHARPSTTMRRMFHCTAAAQTSAHIPVSIVPPTGRAYAGQRNSKDKSWQHAAYTEEIAGPPATDVASNGSSVPAGASAGANGNGNGFANGKKAGKGRKEVVVLAQPMTQAALAARAHVTPRAAAPRAPRRSALMGAPLRMARVGL